MFGWRAAKSGGGHGFGLAAGTEKGSYLATCVEVLADKDSGVVKVIRAVSAFDCGAVVNPNHLKNQVEGALVMGLGGALFEAIDERAERVDRYLGLAASRNASTVTFSLKALGVLDDADRLEPGPLVAAVGPALLARAKGDEAPYQQ